MVASLAVHERAGANMHSPLYGLNSLNSPRPAGGGLAPPGRATVLIIDDHPIVRAGIIDVLRGHSWLVVIGQAADGRQGIDLARQLAPDLIVVDINLPRFNGIAAMKAIRSELPDSKIIILSMHEPQQFALHIIECGARGYVSKRVASSELVSALETVAAGGTWFDSHFSQMLLKAYAHRPLHDESSMSPREREVLVGIAEGLSTKEIAARLDIGVRTVETHRERLTRKLNIRTVAGLTKFALQSGLVPT